MMRVDKRLVVMVIAFVVLLASALSLFVTMMANAPSLAVRKTLAQNTFLTSEFPSKSQVAMNQTTTFIFKRFLQEKFVPTRPLEFMHITKTGGTAIEAAAAKSGVTWGYCKIGYGEYHCENAPDPNVTLPVHGVRLPSSIPTEKYHTCEAWHTPHHWFQPDYYQGSDTFVVVRNPYARAVSEFYSPWGGFRGNECQRSNPVTLNKWIQRAIKKRQQKTNCGHMLPQHYYVLDDNQNQVTTHVLHYENLEVEFKALARAYKLNISLSTPGKYMVGSYHENSPNCTTTRLTTANLSDETIRIINEENGPSFELFGYTRVDSAAEILI